MTLGSSSGFSLIGALSVAGVLSVTALVGMRTMTSLYQVGAKIDTKGLVNSANQSLQSYLGYEGICTLAIKSMILDPTKENSVEFNIPGLGVVAPGKKNPALDIDVNTLSVKDLLLAETDPLGMKIYLGLLRSSYSKMNGDQLAHFKVGAVGTLALMTTSLGQVVKCSMGKLSFNQVPQNTPAVPGTGLPSGGGLPSGQGGGPSGLGNNSPYPPLIAVNPATSTLKCTTVEQCAIYDYFLRNGIPNSYVEADKWMNATPAWKSIANSYIGTMSSLGKLNFLAAVNQAGLVQTGIQGTQGNVKRPDTIDQWVAEAVTNDPAGRVMLTTREGLSVVESLFDTGSGTSPTTKQILRTALTKSPDLTLNSSLGIGAWVDALGFANTAAMANALPGATINMAMSPGAGKDPQALMSVVNYIQANPTLAVDIANGTGLWAKNVNGNVGTVVQYISSNLAANGNNNLAVGIATATNQWAQVVGSQTVGNAIQTNATGSYAIANGTNVWNNAIGTQAVTNAISNNPTAAANVAAGTNAAVSMYGQATVTAAIAANPTLAAQQATAINAAVQAGYSQADIQAYQAANPNTWQNWTGK